VADCLLALAANGFKLKNTPTFGFKNWALINYLKVDSFSLRNAQCHLLWLCPIQGSQKI